ncbi:AMP-binding protein [Alteribacillus bidgolensis]|uniref:Fatty-acyl-CoA synthase n=1 Tax=Alteribacillus bidgolensis TaxID=930129 RepID=A0A1G8N205_9BACI|nr:AMP-binding protein [Alteribacillus bidgolensis]SDI74087.1 fatty-acyl-CoA synthase [Alteribacillus bidgolensis]
MTGTLDISVGKLLEQTACLYGEKEAVVYPDRGLRYTYLEFEEICKKAAKGFINLGVEKGDHIAIWAANKPEWLISQFSTAKTGAILVTVNTNYMAQELEYLLQQSDASTLILQESFKGVSYTEILYDVIPELKNAEPGKLSSDKFPFLKNIIFLGDEQKPGMLTWKQLMDMSNGTSEETLKQRMLSLNPDDVINMQYTSGTTGFPKGVMLTHKNIVNNGLNIAECMELTEEDRLCIPVPFFHCFGCVLGTMACVTKAAAMVPVEEFGPLKVLKAVESEQCTALHGVPTMFIAEMNHPKFPEFNLRSLRTGIMAGSNCPVEVMKGVIEKMGADEITIAYGQTESSPVITQTRVDDSIERRVETVGKALPNVEVKIVNPNTKEELPRGEQGELCTRGYHVMKGYYKQKEATRNVLSEDGWLFTGDLAVMDEGGYCKITGRLKDMIIRGGENIYPREIEEFLYQHPKLLDVQIVGIPNDKYGEEVSAWVRLKEGEVCTADEIRSYCEGKISRHKIPAYITFVDEYPMTASGKIQKFKLRELAKSQFSIK